MDSHLGEHLSVDLDAGLLEAVHQSAVRDVVHSCSSVDAGDPESSELSLAELSAHLCGTQGPSDCRSCCGEDLMLGTEESLREL